MHILVNSKELFYHTDSLMKCLSKRLEDALHKCYATVTMTVCTIYQSNNTTYVVRKMLLSDISISVIWQIFYKKEAALKMKLNCRVESNSVSTTTCGYWSTIPITRCKHSYTAFQCSEHVNIHPSSITASGYYPYSLPALNANTHPPSTRVYVLCSHLSTFHHLREIFIHLSPLNVDIIQSSNTKFEYSSTFHK